MTRAGCSTPSASARNPGAAPSTAAATKCGGDGRTLHECESCRVRVDQSCPACRGRKRYEADCPTCGGTGEIDDSERRGVSVFPDEEGLYRYMRRRGAEIDDACLVELEGEPSPDEDFDADEGAMLIIPHAVVAVREPTATGSPDREALGAADLSRTTLKVSRGWSVAPSRNAPAARCPAG